MRVRISSFPVFLKGQNNKGHFYTNLTTLRYLKFRRTGYSFLICMSNNLLKYVFRLAVSRYRSSSQLEANFKVVNSEPLPRSVFFGKSHVLAKPQAYSSNVAAVLRITFTQSNTWLAFSDSLGHVIFSKPSGVVGLKGKSKLNRHLAVKKLMLNLNKQEALTEYGPVALHMRNVGTRGTSIFKTVKAFAAVASVKTYDTVPFNGCRKKKLKRKKISNIIKR